MTPQRFVTDIIQPGTARLARLGGPPISTQANRLLLAIALQESGPGLTARFQHSPRATPGPARGWWQFERIGIRGVLEHRASSRLAEALVEDINVLPQHDAIWRAVEGVDDLACGFARLLLWQHPQALPIEEVAAWNYYISLWRPGKPHAQNWPANWGVANATV